VWRVATHVCVGLAILSPIVTEVVRSIVHRRRERRDGLGGTQDVALWGTAVGLAGFVGAALSALMWYVTGT
jgi:hypothetical protein